MTHAFSFQYTEKILTSHPLMDVDVTFNVDAEISDNLDETVYIKMVSVKSAIDYAETEMVPVVMPDESTFRGGRFWGLLREAGRNHFYKMQKAKSHEAK